MLTIFNVLPEDIVSKYPEVFISKFAVGIILIYIISNESGLAVNLSFISLMINPRLSLLSWRLYNFVRVRFLDPETKRGVYD